MRSLITLVFILAAGATAFAQGTIRGKATDSQSGETLIGANVFLAGTTQGSSTDLDGNFEINNVTAGTHQLVCRFISYAADTISITVTDGEVTVADFKMGDNPIAIKEFTVTGKANTAGVVYMDEMRRQSSSMIDGMPADQIAKSGDSNVASAVKRGVGVTVEGGKYVYVRGLSDRYSKTTLNGAEIPGLDPERNAVQMDLFPTNLIDNIAIVKSFSPELPASFTGGLVNINTKDFPDRFTLKFATSVSYNTQASLNSNFQTYEGGATDGLGFDDGTRDIPTAVPNIIPERFTVNGTNFEDLSRVTQSFNKEMDIRKKTSGLNQSYSFSAGNQVNLGERKLGYIASMTYQRRFDHYGDGFTGRYKYSGDASSTDLIRNKEFNDARSVENALWGALFNVSLKANSNNKFAFNLMRNQNGIKNTRFQEGTQPEDDPNMIVQNRTLQFLERSMTFMQLKGEHYLPNAGRLKIDWFGAFTISAQDEPDLRFFINDYTISDVNAEDTTWAIQPAVYDAPTRYWRDMRETNIDIKVNFEKPIAIFGDTSLSQSKNKLKWGLSAVKRSRSFNERRFVYNSEGVNFNGSVADYLADENMVGGLSNDYIYLSGFSGTTGNDRVNSYLGDDTVLSAYFMGDIFLNRTMRLIAGARMEKTNIFVRSLAPTKPAGRLDNLDILPAINFSWDVSESFKVRAAYTKTLARPTFRELAPFPSFSFLGDFIQLGNNELKRTLVDNIDLRGEIYPKPGELIAASVFYKRFTDPIERAFNPKAGNLELQFRNVDEANVYGAEIEFRKSLAFISESLNSFTAGANFTYVQSAVSIDTAELRVLRELVPGHEDTRVMFGQSPWIVNSFVNYTSKGDSSLWSANLSFNISGEKMVVVGAKGTPNVLEQPRGQLDFNVRKAFGKGDRFSAKFSARNLLNPDFKQTQEFGGNEYIFQNYKKGRIFGLSLSYTIR